MQETIRELQVQASQDRLTIPRQILKFFGHIIGGDGIEKDI